MKMFKVLVVILILLAGFTWPLLAAEAEDLRNEIQALREEVKSLREELKAVKRGPSEAAIQNESVTQDDLQGVRAEVETLRDQWKRNLDTKTPQTTRSLAFGGTVQTRYTDTQDGNSKDSFNLSSLILSFKGNLRKDYEFGRNLDYAFSVSSATTGDYKIAPLDAYISYSVLPSNVLEQPRLYLFAGQQKKPFGRDPQATEEYKPTIKSAQFDTNLGLGTRDIGLAAKGDLFALVDYGYNYRSPLIEYSLGIVNGNGSNTSDNNNSKDFVGRIVLNAPVDYNSIFRGLSLAGSYLNGKQNRTLTSGSTTITRGYGRKTRFGGDLAYVHTPIGFTAEYAQGEDESVAGTTTAPTYRNVRSDGYVISLFYNYGQQFVKGFKGQNRYDDWYPLTYQPFVRFDIWDPNKKVSDDRLYVTTLGFNWFFAETTKLQFNYNIKQEESNKVDNNEFLAQFQYGF